MKSINAFVQTLLTPVEPNRASDEFTLCYNSPKVTFSEPGRKWEMMTLKFRTWEVVKTDKKEYRDL